MTRDNERTFFAVLIASSDPPSLLLRRARDGIERNRTRPAKNCFRNLIIEPLRRAFRLIVSVSFPWKWSRSRQILLIAQRIITFRYGRGSIFRSEIYMHTYTHIRTYFACSFASLRETLAKRIVMQSDAIINLLRNSKWCRRRNWLVTKYRNFLFASSRESASGRPASWD